MWPSVSVWLSVSLLQPMSEWPWMWLLQCRQREKELRPELLRSHERVSTRQILGKSLIVKANWHPELDLSQGTVILILVHMPIFRKCPNGKLGPHSLCPTLAASDTILHLSGSSIGPATVTLPRKAATGPRRRDKALYPAGESAIHNAAPMTVPPAFDSMVSVWEASAGHEA